MERHTNFFVFSEQYNKLLHYIISRGLQEPLQINSSYILSPFLGDLTLEGTMNFSYHLASVIQFSNREPLNQMRPYL